MKEILKKQIQSHIRTFANICYSAGPGQLTRLFTAEDALALCL